jgi:hypothetical protein
MYGSGQANTIMSDEVTQNGQQEPAETPSAPEAPTEAAQTEAPAEEAPKA